MAEDFISRIQHNKKKMEALRSQTNKNTTPTDSNKKVIRKSIAVDLPTYTKLKIISAKKNIQIKKLVSLALQNAFDNHIYDNL